MAENRCPLCGSETQSPATEDPNAIREQIHRLEHKLQELEGSGQHPHSMTGGYGASPEEKS